MKSEKIPVAAGMEPMSIQRRNISREAPLGFQTLFGNLAWVLSGIVLTVMLINCATTPVTAKDIPAEETMFVVPVVVIDAQTSTFQGGSFGYTVNFENVSTGQTQSFFINFVTADGYHYIKGLPEGKYLIKEYVPSGFKNNDKKALNIQRYLTLEKGKLAVLPMKIVIIVYNPSSADYTASVSAEFLEINDKEEARILDFINSGQVARSVKIEAVAGSISFDVVDWLKHFNFTAGSSGPYWMMADTNVYSLNLVDASSYSYYFSRDASQDIPFPVSLSASLQIPFFYTDLLFGGVSFNFNMVPAKVIYSGVLGLYFGIKLQPFTIFAEGGVTKSFFLCPVGTVGGSGATFSSTFYPADTVLTVTGSSPISFAIGAGVKWQFADWLFLRLKYNFYFAPSISDFVYYLGDTQKSSPTTPQPIGLPQHVISFGIGLGLF